MPEFVTELWRWALARPRRAIALALALPVLASPGLGRLTLATDGRALVADDHPAVLEDTAVRQRFGLRDPLVVVLDTGLPGGLYRAETLRRLADLHRALLEIPGLGPDALTSLASEHRDRVDSLDLSPFLTPLPTTPEEVEHLRRDIEAAGLLDGTLVGHGGQGATVLAGVPSAAELATLGLDRQRWVEMVRRAATRFENSSHRVLVAGAPAAESLLGIHLLRDLALLLPLSLLVLGTVLWLGCRRLWGVALGLSEIAACLVFTFGVMGWLGVPVYLPTAVLPVILATVGLTDEIHLFWHLQRRLDECDAPPEAQTAVGETMRALTRPLVLTSLTTSIGFLAFTVSALPPVRTFGLFAALGVLFCLFWSLVPIPALLSRLPAENLRSPLHRPREGKLGQLGPPLRKRRWLVAAGLLAAAAVAGVGILRLEIQDGWLDNFSPQSEFRRTTERVHSLLHGTHVLLLELSFDPPPERVPEVWDRAAPLLDPELLRTLGALENLLRGLPEVGGVLGPESHLEAVRYLASGRRPDRRSLPGEPEEVNVLWKRFEQGRGIHRRREVADDELRRTLLTVFLKRANYRDTAALVATVRSWVAERFAPWRVELRLGGDVAVSQAMISVLVGSQLRSVALALATLLVLFVVLYRRLVLAALLLTPAALACLGALGVMGWLGVPLGVATSTFCALTLGLGVDFALHFHERTATAVETLSGRDPCDVALDEVGPPILTDTLTLTAGLGLLALSQVPANARLGLVMAVSLAVAAITTVLGLGALHPSCGKMDPHSLPAPPIRTWR